MKIGFRKSGNVEIDGARCIPALWFRFSADLTAKSGGHRIYQESILNNFISCSLPGPCSHRVLIEEIATRSDRIIPIESLPTTLDQQVGLRGRVFFGFPGNYIDQIARNYDGMLWWLSDNGLNMRVVVVGGALSRFDEVAGRLMFEARPKRLKGRLPPTEYARIAHILDKAGFKLREGLEGECRKKLAAWNQKHPNLPVRTFSDWLDASTNRPALSFVRRGIQKRLNRAESRWETLSNLSTR